jgi:phage-related tail fiber protein
MSVEVKVQRLNSKDAGFKETLLSSLSLPMADDEAIDAVVVKILGQVKANGDAVSRATYATLFAAIGTTFGSGNGSTTFNLPDLRGEFVRGWDDSRGVDSGRLMGTSQADEFKSHTHVMSRTLTDLNVDARFDAVSRYATSDDAEYTDRATNATGGTETRPRNISLLACIKF